MGNHHGFSQHGVVVDFLDLAAGKGFHHRAFFRGEVYALVDAPVVKGDGVHRRLAAEFLQHVAAYRVNHGIHAAGLGGRLGGAILLGVFLGNIAYLGLGLLRL